MIQFRWTDEKARNRIIELKLKSRRDIYERASGLYEWLRTNSKLDEFMPLKKHTVESCLEKAKTFTSKKEFIKNASKEYNWFVRNKKLHLLEGLFQFQYKYNLEIILEKRKEYSKKSEFIKNNKGMYNWLGANGLLDKIE